MKRASLGPLALLLLANTSCSTDVPFGEPPDENLPPDQSGEDTPPGQGGGSTDDGAGDDDGGDGAGGGGGGGDDGAGSGGDGNDGNDNSGGGETTELTVPVELVPQVSGLAQERINFAVPLPRGQVGDPSLIRVEESGEEIPAYVRPIAWYTDDSIRSAQIQVDVDLRDVRSLDVVIGREATAGSIEPVGASSTYIRSDGTAGPRVFAVLPPGWLAETGLVGPVPKSIPAAGQTSGAWAGVCDYDRYDTSRFLSDSGSRGAWLYDRPTALYRLHAITGDVSALRSAFREAHIYRDRITGSGSSTRIGVPNASGDLKYHYSQGMAITYLLTGDERLRKRAEDVAIRASDLWSPRYVPGGRFWTERHAGFALLAYVWAARVSHDRRDHFIALADEAVSAYIDGQMSYPTGYRSSDARCFSHTSESAGESYGYEGCSPWLSAILADGLEEYAAERGGQRAARARDSIVLLGRMLARYGRDSGGKPFMWLAGDGSRGTRDAYNEHWGESAYVIAMAWHYDGRRDDSMRQVAEADIRNLARHGVAPHTRSFNWQCRGAPLTPLYLD